MTITNEAQLANSLETLLRVGFDYLGIIDPYDRILVALSALNVYSDKMHKCATVDDLLTYIVDACEIDSVRDALRDTIQTDYKAVREKMRPIMEKARTHVDQLVTQYQRYKEKK